MKTPKSKYATPRVAALAAVLAAGTAMPTLAQASTAANATIQNSVTVNYADAANNPQTGITTTVNVTVELLKATASLTLNPTTPNATIAPGQTTTYQYFLTTNANGPDTFTASASISVDQLNTASTLNISGGGVTLGASTVAQDVVVAASGDTPVLVPRDLVADGVINGIAPGETVVIGTAVFTVAAVGNIDQAGVGTSTLMLTGNGTAANLTAGTLIRERRTVSVTVTPGNYVAPGDKLITHSISATDGTNVTASVANTTTVSGIALTVTKYVRCVPGPIACTNPGAPAFTLNIPATSTSIDYYSAGVSGAPGATLEYLVRIQNTGGANATNVVIQDAIPAFTTLVPASLAVHESDGDFVTVNILDSNGDAGEASTSTVYLYPGSDLSTNLGNDGAAGVGNGTGGVISGGQSAYGRFQVTIN